MASRRVHRTELCLAQFVSTLAVDSTICTPSTDSIYNGDESSTPKSYSLSSAVDQPSKNIKMKHDPSTHLCDQAPSDGMEEWYAKLQESLPREFGIHREDRHVGTSAEFHSSFSLYPLCRLVLIHSGFESGRVPSPLYHIMSSSL